MGYKPVECQETEGDEYKGKPLCFGDLEVYEHCKRETCNFRKDCAIKCYKDYT